MKTTKCSRDFKLSAATNGRILSLREDRSLVFVGTKHVPGFGTSMTADTCMQAMCPGECRYCFCALSIRVPDPQPYHYVRKALPHNGIADLIKIINITKPDLITTAEKIELGFSPDAISELKALRAGVRPETFMIFTTKFPDVWKQLDMPNTGMIVTLSNPTTIRGLEPHVPDYMDRAMGAFKAAIHAKHLKVGVRLLIMQREDIEYFRKMVVVLKPYLHPNMIWADFLRSPFVAKAGKFYRALRPYLDLSQFSTHANHGVTVREDIMEKAATALSPHGVIFDRLPVFKRKENFAPRIVDTDRRAKCYVRADGTECLRGATGWQDHFCWGRLRPNYRGQGGMKWARRGNFCINLTDMTPDNYKKTHDLWHWIGDVKAFAYGKKTGDGNQIYREVMRTLHDPVLLKHIFGDGAPMLR